MAKDSAINYDAEKIQFFAWLMSPDRDGTQRDYARQHGIAEQTLSEWKHSDEAREILLRWQEPFRVRFVEVARTLHRIATDPDHPAVVQAARTVAELLDVFPSKSVNVQHNVTVTGMYAAAAAALEDGVIEGEVQE